MNQRLESSNRVKNFENVEPEESIEQIERNEVIQEIQNSTNFEVKETKKEDEIDLNKSPEEIWQEIKGAILKVKKRTSQIDNIWDLLELSFTKIVKGTIGNTLVRDIINAMLRLEEQDKITSYCDSKKGLANKERVENARRLLEQKALEGGLGKEAQEEYNNQLEEEIDSNGSAEEEKKDSSESPEEIWQEIKGAILKVKKRTSQIDNIWDLLELSFTKIVKGTIGNTLVRDIINAMLRLEGQDKITSYCDSKKDPANKERVENAKEKLKNLVTEGKLGSDTQEEFAKYLKENPVVKEEEIDLSGSAEEIWKQIKRKYIKYINHTVYLDSIKDLLELNLTSITIGTIGSTPVRKIINVLLGFEDDKKINTKRSRNEKGKINRERVEEALKLLKLKALEGGLGKEAQAEYAKYLEENPVVKEEEIDLNRSAEEIWKQIKGKEIKYRGSTYQINKISDLKKLSNYVIMKGKIGNTLVREIINAMLELNDKQKITSHTQGNSGSTNIENIEYARKKLKEKVLEGLGKVAKEEDLGKEAQEEYNNQLEEEIDSNGSAEEIWKSINLPATIFYNGKQNVIHTIQDFIRLKKTCIIEGKIGNTLVREIINAMLELDDGKKITWHNGKPYIEENKRRIEEALKLLKLKALEGGLGKEAQAEYAKYLEENPVVKEEEIDLSGSAEEIWKRIKLPATIFYNGQQIVIHTIQDFIRLKKTCIIEGKIGNTLVREIINAMLELKEDKKITSHRLNDKGKANKLRLEKARRLLEQKVTKGGLGKEAQADYVKSEIQEKQEKIQNLILEKINFIKSKIINENKIEFDSMEEYVIGEILEKYLINENGESFRLETNTNFQVEIEKDNNSRNSKLDFLISKEFTIKGWDSIVIEWHPIRLDLKKKKLKKEIENTENKEKKEELRKRIEKIDQKDSEAIEKIKKEYEAKRQDLAEKKFVKETIVIRTFQEKYNREDLYEFLKEFTITNSTFPENQEEFTTQFQNIYSQISTIQEKKKQRVTRIKIEEYLEENNEHSIQELTDEQITDIWNTSFNFDGSKNKISQRIKNSETHTKKEKKDTQIGYKRRNLIAFYNCDEYKLKDEELEAHINQKIEEIRSEISELESILEPEQDLEETQEQGFEDTQVEELIEPVEIYQEFQLTSY